MMTVWTGKADKKTPSYFIFHIVVDKEEEYGGYDSI